MGWGGGGGGLMMFRHCSTTGGRSYRGLVWRRGERGWGKWTVHAEERFTAGLLGDVTVSMGSAPGSWVPFAVLSGAASASGMGESSFLASSFLGSTYRLYHL